jgi:hypothetical protein
MQSPPQAFGHFKGDSAHLVDALVAASAYRPSPEDSGYSGYGRELVAWTPDDGANRAWESLEVPAR